MAKRAGFEAAIIAAKVGAKMGGGDFAKAAQKLTEYLRRVWRAKKALKMRG